LSKQTVQFLREFTTPLWLTPEEKSKSSTRLPITEGRPERLTVDTDSEDSEVELGKMATAITDEELKV